ncbi:rubredoxin [Cupriavidus basilensis]
MSTNETPTLDAVNSTEADVQYRSWLCVICGFVYNERDGIPDEGIAPGTKWEDVPEDWICDDCGAGKSDFEMIEV